MAPPRGKNSRNERRTYTDAKNADLAGNQLKGTTAPEFQATGTFGYGGYGEDMSQYWGGWQPPIVQQPPLWREYTAPDGTPYYYNSKTGLCQWEKPPELEPPAPPRASEPLTKSSALSTGKESIDRGRRDKDADRDDARRGLENSRAGNRKRVVDRAGSKDEHNSSRGGGGKEAADFGPPGCNLFVFHLPDEWNDEDLNEYFAPHGTVVSAKVMKELGTGRSRGFGFVSYEDRMSAATAIKKMQGYKCFGKRLKVEFKKGEQDSGADVEDGMFDMEDSNGAGKKNYPDDEKLIGYLRAISAKKVVQSLEESEAAQPVKETGELEESGADMPEDQVHLKESVAEPPTM